MKVMSRVPPGEISIDDIDDAEFELADVITPSEQASETPVLAAGSESRRRIVMDQHEPSSLDLQLIAYLLDIEPPDGSSDT